MLAIDHDNWFGRIGGFLLVLGIVVLFAPVPWDLGPCPADQNKQTEYHQPFLHDVENVSQIPLGFAAKWDYASVKAMIPHEKRTGMDVHWHTRVMLTTSHIFARRLQDSPRT
jgi:hypothetical protein